MTLDPRAQLLILRHLDGIASEQETRALDQELASNPEVAGALARAALMDAHLTTVLAEWPALSARRSGRPWRRIAAGLSLAAALAVVGGLIFRLNPAHETAARAHSATPEPTWKPTVLHLEDGSTITPLAEGTFFERGIESQGETAVALIRGSARFDIAHDPSRVFRVVAGALTVEVLGTSFTLAIEADQVHLSVERGRVRALSQSGTTYLSEGQQQSFDFGAASANPAASVRPAEPIHEPKGAWRGLAHRGDYEHAFESLQREGLSAVRDDPGELMLAADAARLSKHPAQALAPLRKLVANHRKDSRAPLAAFTLGRVLLDELGNPREAAGAFAEARALIGDGSLAEDALAREIEAWSRAGVTEKARKLALQYVERYPGGSKLQSVRRYGRLP